MKLMAIFGTRPEVIKLAPVITAARMTPGVEMLACSSGQHRQMLDQALGSFGLVPDIELSLMRVNQTLSELTASLLESLTKTLIEHKPDVVIVQGDTTSAFVGALAAFYQGIPVAHVEAGLRTGDLSSPFPEEANRSMLARLARWHFAPTEQARNNLINEGIHQEWIHCTGNTVVDAIELIRQRWKQDPYAGPESQLFPNQQIVLVTTHRRENFGQGLENICEAVASLCQQHPALGFVFPVHLNPKVGEVVHQRLANIANLRLCAPVDFEACLHLQSRASLILTDSGGIQEESPSFGVPCVVMREHTERREGIDAGFATLSGTNAERIMADAQTWLAQPDATKALKKQPNPYGDGHASARIIEAILAALPTSPHAS